VLPLVALVIAAQQIDLDAEPEQGIDGVLAEAEDKLNPAPELAKQAKEEVQTINLSLKDNLKALLEMCQHGSEEEWTNVYNKLIKFCQQLDKAIRRSAKAKEKMESENRNSSSYTKNIISMIAPNKKMKTAPRAIIFD
jgi:rubrerythrin